MPLFTMAGPKPLDALASRKWHTAAKIWGRQSVCHQRVCTRQTIFIVRVAGM